MTSPAYVVVQHAEKDPAAPLADPGLSALGQKQARLTGVQLRVLGVRRVITSPLRRAHETARIAAMSLEGTTPAVMAVEEVKVETDARLRERMNWGDGSVRQTLEEFLVDWSRATADRDYTPSAGDSSRAAGARFRALLDELAATRQDGPVALVTHGGVTADLLRTLFGDEQLNSLRPDLIARGVPGCALTHLTKREQGRYRLLQLASVEHLPLSLRTG